jgi:hypothetical protein
MTITTERAEECALGLDAIKENAAFIGYQYIADNCAIVLRSLAAERDDLAKRLKDAERERNHQHGRADRNAAQYAAEQAKREQLQAENEKLRAALRAFIYTGNVVQGYRVGQNPPPPTASEEEAWAHYGGSEFHYQQWLEWRAVQMGRELLGEEE